VPQQENDYDCGVFVLYNMQRFIQEAPQRLNKKKLPMVSNQYVNVFHFLQFVAVSLQRALILDICDSLL
jgi:Ulp1 family protease